MNANELKAKARERLAEITKQRAALDAEEREIRVMLGDVPPAPTVSPWPHDVLIPPWPRDPDVTCAASLVANEDHALDHGVITSRTTGCAVPA